MDFKLLEREDLQRVSDFIEPLFLETYEDKVTNGLVAVKAIFDRWDTIEPLKRKYDSGVRYFMYSENGKDIALVAMVQEQDGVMYIDKMYVSRDHQGEGIGTKAMEFAFDYGRKCGCDVITTHSNAANSRAIALYQKFGMKIAATVHRNHDGGEYDYAYLVGTL